MMALSHTPIEPSMVARGTMRIHLRRVEKAVMIEALDRTTPSLIKGYVPYTLVTGMGSTYSEARTASVLLQKATMSGRNRRRSMT